MRRAPSWMVGRPAAPAPARHSWASLYAVVRPIRSTTAASETVNSSGSPCKLEGGGAGRGHGRIRRSPGDRRAGRSRSKRGKGSGVEVVMAGIMRLACCPDCCPSCCPQEKSLSGHSDTLREAPPYGLRTLPDWRARVVQRRRRSRVRSELSRTRRRCCPDVRWRTCASVSVPIPCCPRGLIGCARRWLSASLVAIAPVSWGGLGRGGVGAGSALVRLWLRALRAARRAGAVCRQAVGQRAASGGRARAAHTHSARGCRMATTAESERREIVSTTARATVRATSRATRSWFAEGLAANVADPRAGCLGAAAAPMPAHRTVICGQESRTGSARLQPT